MLLGRAGGRNEAEKLGPLEPSLLPGHRHASVSFLSTMDSFGVPGPNMNLIVNLRTYLPDLLNPFAISVKVPKIML
jgi:hypothetical protein